MQRNCATCLTKVDDENASILTMGAYGTPKCLCEDCAALVETMTGGREYDAITSAMDALTEKMSKANIDDRVTVATVTELLADSARRAEAIKDGTYDFSADGLEDEESFEEIPDELKETEEDRLLDEKDAEEAKKIDKMINYMWIGVGIAVLIFAIYKLIEAII